MAEKDRWELTGDARSNILLRQEALRRASASNGSPPAVEATLASISAEVMNEAIARRNRAVKSP